MGEAGTELNFLSQRQFVGRERELAELLSACEAGADSETHLFLIHGEPGIGKTRLADELSSRAKARGLRVLWGRCWEGGGAPAYWPWIQVIRNYVASLDSEQRKQILESEIASDTIHEVAQLVPDLRHAQSPARPPTTERLSPEEARFRLFDAVTNFLKLGARERPMLIILDDIHGADEASLALLRFFAAELRTTPILVIAIHRDVEVERSRALSATIGQIARNARSIPMRGLSESEVRRFVEVTAGKDPHDHLVARLRNATSGNPLFLEGIVRILVAESAIGSSESAEGRFKIPVGVREAIRRQMEGLSPEARGLLNVASAIGKEFDLDLCCGVAEKAEKDALRWLNEAMRAGILTEAERGRYRFSHALIRDTVYEELDAGARTTIHRAIATRLEEKYQAQLATHAAELAHHFREANDSEKAIDYLVRAGRAAASVFAFTDAMMHLQAALELMEQHDSDAIRRAELLHLLGTVAFSVDRVAALKYGEAAIALYESVGRIDRAARLHILVGTIFHMRGEPLSNATLATDHLRLAESELLKEPETRYSALLYNTIAANEANKLNFVDAAIAAGRGMEISESLGDKLNWPWAAATQGECLCMKGQLSEGFALFERAFEVNLATKQSGFPTAWRAGFFCTLLGDPLGARVWWERELKRIRRVASPIAFNFFSTWIDITRFDEGYLVEMEKKYSSDPNAETFGSARRFWMSGQWEDAASLMEREVELCDRKDNQYFALSECVFAGLTNLLAGEQARAEALFRYGFDETDEGVKVLLEMRARPWLARLYVEMKQLDEAAEQVARCRQIMAAGEDWRGLAGNVALAEAVVAADRGNYDMAYRQFESALAIHRKYHLAWAEADTLRYWGRALAATGDRAGAALKFDAAIENHRSRGVGPRFLDWLATDKVHALENVPARTTVVGVSHPESVNPQVTGEFVREGEFWTITYQGSTFRLKDAKGFTYLATLLARPGERFHSKDLITIVEASSVGKTIGDRVADANLTIGNDLDGASVRDDSRLRSQYRERISDLKAELDAAEQANDIGRIERLREELDFLTEELISTSGIRKRSPQSSAHAERARVMVGKNIRSAIEKIRRQSAPLGRHLANTIRTGYFCSYEPDRDIPVTWQL